MGQQVSVETFTSLNDTEGHKYWTSFDPYPFKVGSRKLVYMGIFNGQGPLQGQKCIVKTTRQGNAIQNDWMLELKSAKEAQSMANAYNRTVSCQGSKVAFNCPIIAEIDTMSDCLCINDILGKPNKKWCDSEHVSIEPYLKGKFEDFEYGWVTPERLQVPEAFSHFTWCRSEGNLLVSNLQGIIIKQTYHLTGPLIHSTDMKYGNSDLGSNGIKGFFKLHKCNSICNNWPRLGDGRNLHSWGESFCFDGNSPSAPPMSLCIPPPPAYDECEFESEYSTRYDECLLAPNSKEFGTQTQESWQVQQCTKPSTISCNRSDDRGFVIDWREQILNQSTRYVPNFQFDNPMFQHHMFGMQTIQTIWFVKQIRFTPPPPYCKLDMQTNSIVQHKFGQRVRFEDDEGGNFNGADDDSDEKYLLPPPYSEESVDPNLECVTYL